MKKIKVLIYCLVVILGSSCGRNETPIEIVKLNLPLSYCNDNICTEAYGIRNYDLKEDRETLDEFVCKNFSKRFSKNTSYEIVFYKIYDKGSSKLNEKTNLDKDLLEWHFDDLLLVYSWKFGNFFGVSNYIDKSNVIYYQKSDFIEDCTQNTRKK